MMTQELRASILTAPLAAIDRRALSQAWYSALHLARRSASASPPSVPAKPVFTPAGFAKTSPTGTEPPGRSTFAPAVRTPARVRETPAEGIAADRRAPRSALARSIERAFLDPRWRLERSTFSVGDGGARVHVVLQTSRNRARLVAICPPAAKGAVARALAQARFALASRGIPLDLEDAGALPCF
ncbi:MAG: hypothetical protein ABI231_06190 [Candidatus Tumulicola sp.]